MADQQRVTAESYGKIDVSDATSECWMIRFPRTLASILEKVPEGTPIGELVFTKGGGGGATTTGGKSMAGGGKPSKPSLTVHIDEQLAKDMMAQEKQRAAQDGDKKKAAAGGASSSSAAAASSLTTGALPLNYSLQAMTKKVPVMYPFVRNPKNGSVKLLGQVSRTANLQVEQDKNYRDLLKDRLVAQNITSSRYVKPVEATESVMNKQQQSGSAGGAAAAAAAASSGAPTKKRTFGNAVLGFGQRMLELSQETSLHQQMHHQVSNKKARQFAPDQPLRSVVFELFGQQQYWAVKDLKAAAVAGGASHAATKKAEAEIRKVLSEIGHYHRSGDHKTMWELKSEFQSASIMQTSTGSGVSQGSGSS